MVLIGHARVSLLLPRQQQRSSQRVSGMFSNHFCKRFFLGCFQSLFIFEVFTVLEFKIYSAGQQQNLQPNLFNQLFPEVM